MNLQSLKSTFKVSKSLGLLKLQKHSPEILLATGIAGTLTATVLACRATLKSQEVLKTHKSMMADINKATSLGVDSYTAEDRRKDVVVAYTKTSVDMLKLYWPSITLYTAGIACILGGHRILNKRNVALLGAFKLVEEGFNEYRGRVVEELGEEKDLQFRHGINQTTKVTKTVGKDGKKKTVKTKEYKLNPEVSGYSIYARLFEPQKYEHGGSWTGSSQFSSVHSYNYAYITQKMKWFNDRLNAEGVIFLNDVYEELGFPRTAVGQQVGWVKNNPDGDGYISFGPALDLLAYRDGDPILLDFNVDGFVLDLI